MRGTNSRCRAIRATKIAGVVSERAKHEAEIPEAVPLEATGLGLCWAMLCKLLVD